MRETQEIRSYLAAAKRLLRSLQKDKSPDRMFPAMESSIKELETKVIIRTLEWVLKRKQAKLLR